MIKIFKKKSLTNLKKMLTGFKPSATLSKSLESDNKKQKVTAKVVERKWSLKIEQNIYKYI